MQDAQLRALALTLYERHKEAFDYVFECRPEPETLLTVVRQGVQGVQGVQGLITDVSSKDAFRFLPEIWDKKLQNIKGDPSKWTKTGRGILFEVKASPQGRVNIALILGPGDLSIRKQVYDAAAARPDLFAGRVKPMGPQWTTIFSQDLQTSVQAKGLTFEAQSTNVRHGWLDFQGGTLQPLTDAVLTIDEQIDRSPSGPRKA